MESSIFLATILGWYLVIIGLFVLFRQNIVKPIMEDILSQRALLFIMALITLMVGLLLVLSHNVWVMEWPVIITILAWMILVGGILRLFAPEYVIRMGRRFLKKPVHITIMGIINLVIGLFLLFRVYFMVG